MRPRSQATETQRSSMESLGILERHAGELRREGPWDHLRSGPAMQASEVQHTLSKRGTLLNSLHTTV